MQTIVVNCQQVPSFQGNFTASINILDIHRDVLQKFKENISSLPTLKSYLQELTISRAFMYSCQTKIPKELDEDIAHTQLLIQNIETGESQSFYLLQATQILREYSMLNLQPIKRSFFGVAKQSEIQNNQELGKKLQDILKKYINCLRQFFQLKIVYTNEKGVIETSRKKHDGIKKENMFVPCECGNKNEFIPIDDRVYVCVSCGLEREMVIATKMYNDSTRTSVNAKFKYEKDIHFKDRLCQIQAKQNKVIPPEIYNKIKDTLEKYGLVNKVKDEKYKKITIKGLWKLLSDLKYDDLYSDVYLMHYELTGIEPLRFSQTLEEAMIVDFGKLVDLYLYDPDIDREDGESFLRSHYVIYQLLMKYNFSCDISHFNIIKSTSRLHFYDDVCRKMFNKLGWPHSTVSC